MILFGMSVSKDSPEDAINNYFESFSDDEMIDTDKLTSIDLEFIKETVHGVYANKEKIDEIISKHSKGYTVERISRTALTALRICVFEMIYRDDIPVNVSVNEAIETVKVYEDEKTKKFVNGVLGGVASEKTK